MSNTRILVKAKKAKNQKKKFSPELLEFIGRKMATRAQAFKIVIAYVKEHKLQVSRTVESRPKNSSNEINQFHGFFSLNIF